MADGDAKFQLSAAQLRDVRDLWFEHLTSSEDFVLPRQKQNERWFVGSEAFDHICVERFAAILEGIRKSNIKTGTDILEVAKPDDPLDWLSLVILLDQIPRNCYRGDAAAVAFTFFDPIAYEVARAAIERGLPEVNPQLRWQLAYRQWFYLPFMHSEDLGEHTLALRAYDKMRKDVYTLAEEIYDAEPLEPLQGYEQPDYRARAAKVVRANAERYCLIMDRKVLMEKKHMDIIKRFGRYPHRNKAMRRISTAEETEYLENGGETFG
ncbi:hypothetical protein HIM_08454 [Hirsutella minnesotensis 3608]|uniref:DUF924-domain-containing protein n=1 Tax=Hirsutella minnesotensis 3608 TaxID=1043627 RepID=A0A0F8A3P5_9HYPO|nr:hypothetical protein HIM_08454 [Hirsutella minnesotensis 3608]